MNQSETIAVLRILRAAYKSWKCDEETIAVYALAWARAPAEKMRSAATSWLRGDHSFAPTPGELLARAGFADPDHAEPLPPYLAHPWGSLEPAEWVERARRALVVAKEAGDAQSARHWSHALRVRERILAAEGADWITAGEVRMLKGFGADRIGGGA